jgi:steroid delta-isomerase
MADDHPARLAAQRSMDAVHCKDKDAWVGNFAPDGVVQDPVGASPLDPSGEGHRGRDAIAAFWDKQIAPNRVLFNIVDSFACGDECANVGSLTVVLENGLVTLVNGVFVYRVNAEGELASLRAFWEFDQLKVIQPAG